MHNEQMHFEIVSNAKINTYLKISRRESSGMHILRSAIFPVKFSDYIHIDIQSGTGQISLQTSISSKLQEHIKFYDISQAKEVNEMLDGITGKDNIALKAAQIIVNKLSLVKETNNVKHIDIAIKLFKNIPFGAGLGGGSANAASIAKKLPEILINTFCKIDKIDKHTLSKIRLDAELEVCKIGSDIPALLENHPVFILGNGNVVREMRELNDNTKVFWKKLGIVILKPPCSISTKLAYSWLNLDKTHTRFNEDNSELVSELELADIIANRLGFYISPRLCRDMTANYNEVDYCGLTRALSECNSESSSGLCVSSHFSNVFYNDFTDVVFSRYPLVEEAIAVLRKGGSLASLLSGSGSAVFGLFANISDAMGFLNSREYLSLKERGFFSFVTNFIM